ncbi:3'5'-cyclic nucleotide phosphodiesterase domain-containing protein [Besnoitia besnoiti]|uniref:Phosphodiesterase n=1 Tax=Besnoitia besnoiti TaxID=94643 RepID=A0A2A9MGW4_BESBE|nr:3'5'-cyclic nucleotide phosphodiesterase domain-containing protein [Besnoitia besnoiti]PFH36394.1 3'5'-cyclic nucleotide phosphodiesterase domain-containing protein [Besnoitia besnoiti]
MGRLRTAFTRVGGRMKTGVETQGLQDDRSVGAGSGAPYANRGSQRDSLAAAGLEPEADGPGGLTVRPPNEFGGRSAFISLATGVVMGEENCPRRRIVAADATRAEEEIPRVYPSRAMRGLESGLSLLAVSPSQAGEKRANLSTKFSTLENPVARRDTAGEPVGRLASRPPGAQNGDAALRVRSFSLDEEPDRTLSIKIRGVDEAELLGDAPAAPGPAAPAPPSPDAGRAASLDAPGARKGCPAGGEGRDEACTDEGASPGFHRGVGKLEALYIKLCKHPVYKFFSEEDRRYFDMAVTGIPCYFSSKNLERAYTFYSCPAPSNYLILFHIGWMLTMLLIYIVCVATRSQAASSRRMALPFVVAWVISSFSVFVVFLWKQTGGAAAERFNRREKALIKADEVGAVPMYEAFHWRPCFTEDFGAASIALTLIIPMILSSTVAACIGANPSIILDYPDAQARLVPVLLDTQYGLAGFLASQASLATIVLFTAVAITSSGIRLRKILYVAAAIMVCIMVFLICLVCAYEDRALIVPPIFVTYFVIPACLYCTMRLERLRRFLFFQRERARFGQDVGAEATGASGSATLVEELILLINEAGLKIRCARKKMKYKKCTDLVESEGMLIRCLMILTAGDDLFALRLDREGNEDEELRENLMDFIGARCVGDVPASRGLVSTGQLTLSVSAVSEDDDDLLGELAGKPSDAQEMTSFYAECPEDLWGIVDLRDSTETPPAGEGRDTASKKKSHSREANILFSHFPKFPTARLHVMLSSKVSIDWNLSMIEVDQQCKGWCLYCVGSDLLFCKVQGFECDRRTIQNFMQVAQMCYQPTIYHNHLHGAQVAHNTVWLARKLDLAYSLTAPDLVALIVAALCHDIGHQGRNNAYYVGARSPLSIIYNDQAVLENFHACLTFKILGRQECNLFGNLPPEEYQAVRNRMIDLILATDMKMHFETISKFRLRRNSPEFCRRNEEDVWMMLRMCIKGGDVSHGVLPWESHVSWSYRAASEFYEQGDLELRQGRTITPMFDRKKHADFPKGQEGFLKFIVIPLYEEIAAVDASNELQGRVLQNAFANTERWRQLQTSPEEFEEIDAKQQAVLSVLKDRLEWRLQKNFAPTQSILRAASHLSRPGSSGNGLHFLPVGADGAGGDGKHSHHQRGSNAAPGAGTAAPAASSDVPAAGKAAGEGDDGDASPVAQHKRDGSVFSVAVSAVKGTVHAVANKAVDVVTPGSGSAQKRAEKELAAAAPTPRAEDVPVMVPAPAEGRFAAAAPQETAPAGQETNPEQGPSGVSHDSGSKTLDFESRVS